MKKGEANARPRVKPIDHPNQQEVKIVTKDVAFHPSPPKPSNGNLGQADLAAGVAADAAYEGGDEHEDVPILKRANCDFDFHDQPNSMGSNQGFIQLGQELLDNKSGRDEALTPDLQVQSGHVSDPGMERRTSFLVSPVLKRSCSNIETKRSNLQASNPPTRSHSYTDLKNLSTDGNSVYRVQTSPWSAKSNCSADRVMLKKRSSSQVLPSRSRKVWWKLFLWSHRNLHKPSASARPPLPRSASHQKAGYSSDTLEPARTHEDRKKKAIEESGMHWVAFAMESSSPIDRINAWVNSIDETEFCHAHDYGSDNDGDEGHEEEEKKGSLILPIYAENGESSGKNHSSHADRRTTEEIMHANNVIQSLNFLSSVAHISGMGLKVVPSISAFSGLRNVNLSGNLIGMPIIVKIVKELFMPWSHS